MEHRALAAGGFGPDAVEAAVESFGERSEEGDIVQRRRGRKRKLRNENRRSLTGAARKVSMFLMEIGAKHVGNMMIVMQRPAWVRNNATLTWPRISSLSAEKPDRTLVDLAALLREFTLGVS